MSLEHSKLIPNDEITPVLDLWGLLLFLAFVCTRTLPPIKAVKWLFSGQTPLGKRTSFPGT